MCAASESAEEPTLHRSSMLDDLVAAREALERTADTSNRLSHPPVVEPGSPLKLLGLAGAAGVVLFVVGFGLATLAFGETFMERDAEPAWEAAGAVGGALLVAGFALAAISSIGVIAVGIGRMNRRKR